MEKEGEEERERRSIGSRLETKLESKERFAFFAASGCVLSSRRDPGEVHKSKAAAEMKIEAEEVSVESVQKVQ